MLKLGLVIVRTDTLNEECNKVVVCRYSYTSNRPFKMENGIPAVSLANDIVNLVMSSLSANERLVTID